MDKKKVMGLFTFSVLVGGTAYCIYKYMEKQKLDEGGEGEITLAEARELLKQREREVEQSTAKVAEAFGMSQDEIGDMIDEARDEASFNSSFKTSQGYDFYDGLDYQIPLAQTLTEEDNKLRFEPNTIQARDQFIKMELSELVPSQPEYQIMKRLYDFNFEPLNDGDDTLYTQLADYRSGFFGEESKWIHNVSMADVICHYARLTDFEVGGSVGHWIIEFVNNAQFNELDTSGRFQKIIQELNQHSYTVDDGIHWGFFGLNNYDMTQGQRIADETIDGEMTYEIEFNEHLKKLI